MNTSSHAYYQSLCEEIWKHSHLYYVVHAPTISDEQFDKLFAELVQLEREHPDWITPGSPTQRVNESLTPGFKTVTHDIPMLSLANTYSKEEIEEFIKRMHKLTGTTELGFSCELKMDGIAISAHYEKGVFVRGVTRGDGKQGDDITQNMRTIPALPLRLYGTPIPDELELRGEVFMTHEVFKKLNDQRAEKEEVLWANPRNASAGSLKLLDPKEVARRKLSVVFYGVADESSHSIQSQYHSHGFLEKLGLPTLHQKAFCHNLDEIWAFAEKVREMRLKLPFDIDGIVIKLDDLQEQKHLGSTGKNPRWAIAYKFAAEQARTRIHQITVQVGRTGVLTPVAELDPVFLAGSTISRATLHNMEEIQRKDIREGDIVYIEKGGDVIPKVLRADTSMRPNNSVEWEMPQTCPSCGTPVVHVTGEVAVRCPNTLSCPDQHLKRLIYFAGKDAMDIENLGDKIMEHLVVNGFVKRPSDIYRLTANELAQLEGFKEKSIHNLLTSIETSKKVSLARFLMALGIKHIGTGTAEMLANALGSLDGIARSSKEDLIRIEGIGDKVASAIVEFFAEPQHLEEIELLKECGVVPQVSQVQVMADHAFVGKTFVITGTLEKYSRAAAANLIKERGGKVSESVSKKTDFVLAGESPGSKLEKAHALGVKVLSEADFEALL